MSADDILWAALGVVALVLLIFFFSRNRPPGT